jgi:hypothetical protein
VIRDVISRSLGGRLNPNTRSEFELDFVERGTGLEPATSTLGKLRSAD